MYVCVCSEVQGHENPVFLGGSPQIKTRTVSQIMARQSSETGRHLLSEPGTPLSPPAHGDVFFPVEGRNRRVVTAPPEIKITDSDKRRNSPTLHKLLCSANTLSLHCHRGSGKHVISWCSAPCSTLQGLDHNSFFGSQGCYFLLCNSITLSVQTVFHFPVLHKAHFESTHFKMCNVKTWWRPDKISQSWLF